METFREFNENFNNNLNIDNFEEIYKKLAILVNKSYPIDEEPMIDLPHKFVDPNDLSLIELSDIDDEITKEDKRSVIDCYQRFYDLYNLENFPDVDLVNDYLVGLCDLVNINKTYFIEKHQISLLIPLIKTPKLMENNETINITEYEEIHNEIFTLITRLKSEGMKTVVTLNPRFIMNLTISYN